MPDDEPAVRLSYSIERARLARLIERAPSLEAWCDAAYRAYGPDGDVIKGLMKRVR